MKNLIFGIVSKILMMIVITGGMFIDDNRIKIAILIVTGISLLVDQLIEITLLGVIDALDGYIDKLLDEE